MAPPLVRGSAKQAAPARFVLACCTLGPLVFGIDARYIAAIEDYLPSDEGAPPFARAPEGALLRSADLLDLAQELGLRQSSFSERDARQKCLTLEVSGQSARLLVGTEVAVRELTGRLQALPAFVAGLGSRASIVGLIALERRYLFLLDVARLVERFVASRASGVGP